MDPVIKKIDVILGMRTDPLQFVECRECVFWSKGQSRPLMNYSGEQIGVVVYGCCRRNAPTHQGFPQTASWPEREDGCGDGLKRVTQVSVGTEVEVSDG